LEGSVSAALLIVNEGGPARSDRSGIGQARGAMVLVKGTGTVQSTGMEHNIPLAAKASIPGGSAAIITWGPLHVTLTKSPMSRITGSDPESKSGSRILPDSLP
jgi:hypothetical protein